MDCQQIIELVMKKANEDKEFKKKLIENSEQAILDETGMTMAHKINFFEDDNGELSYEVSEEEISDNDLENLAGGAGLPHEELYKLIKEGKRPSYKEIFTLFKPYPQERNPIKIVADYACPSIHHLKPQIQPQQLTEPTPKDDKK